MPSSAAEPTPVIVIIDRIEGDHAVLIPNDAPEPVEWVVPRALLPARAKEGWALRWTIERDPATERARKRALTDRLNALLAGEHLDP